MVCELHLEREVLRQEQAGLQTGMKGKGASASRQGLRKLEETIVS